MFGFKMPSPFQVLHSNRGQVLVSTIVLSLIVAGMTGFLLDQSVQTEKSLRVPRIKSIMNGFEAKIRLASLQPQTFSCPTNATATTNSSLCTMNTNFAELTEVIPGCQAAAGPCGVVVQNIALAGTTLRADVVYQGEELSIAPLNLVFEIPRDVLQATDSNCASINPARPVFAGYKSDGSLNCLPLPADCPPGQYASSVNVSTLALNCLPLPTPANACGANEYMTGVTWNGGASFTVTCAPRLDPFAYSSFTPTLTVRTTPYSTPTPMPANGVCTPSGPCVPGAVTDTGCIAVGTMGTWNGCAAGSRAEPTCSAAVPTTTSTTTTTTSSSTTSTTLGACQPDGYATSVMSGADDTLCTSLSPWAGFGPLPNPICCSGTHSATFGFADTIGGGKCYWKCGGGAPPTTLPAEATPTCSPSQARLGGSCLNGGHPINWSAVCVTAHNASFSWECASPSEAIIVPCPQVVLQDMALCP